MQSKEKQPTNALELLSAFGLLAAEFERLRADFEALRAEVQPQKEEPLTATEVADLLKISRPTLWRLRADGLFPDPITLGKGSSKLLWLRSTVEAWLKANAEPVGSGWEKGHLPTSFSTPAKATQNKRKTQSRNSNTKGGRSNG